MDGQDGQDEEFKISDLSFKSQLVILSILSIQVNYFFRQRPAAREASPARLRARATEL